jgi:hypothetical protein
MTASSGDVSKESCPTLRSASSGSPRTAPATSRLSKPDDQSPRSKNDQHDAGSPTTVHERMRSSVRGRAAASASCSLTRAGDHLILTTTDAGTDRLCGLTLLRPGLELAGINLVPVPFRSQDARPPPHCPVLKRRCLLVCWWSQFAGKRKGRGLNGTAIMSMISVQGLQ